MSVDAPHILVVDDDRRLRELLLKFLSENGFTVSTAENAQDAREKLKSLSFDLMIVDIMMPGENGLDLTRSLRQTCDVPILLLTAMSQSDQRIAGFESGADDYLTKPFEPRELVLRIESILRRRPAPGGEPLELVNFGEFSFHLERQELLHNGKRVSLTTTETNLLGVLARTNSAPVARDALGRAGGIDGGGGEGGETGSGRTIDVQVARLRRKIEVDPKNPRYLQTVRGQGYLLRTD